MQVLFVDSNHPILHETLQKAGFDCDLFWEKSADELLQLLSQYEILVIRSKFKINRTLIDNCPKLKCIARVGAGLENIDLKYAESKGILALSVPEGNRDAVGEHAIGMLLMLLNHLKKADDEVRKGIWIRAENRGTEIMGKTIGILGYGNTGKAFAQKLSGFGCQILAYDKYINGFSNSNVKEVSMNEIFENCDILSLHLPYTEETHHLVNAAFLSSFKKNIYLINTARGACVKTSDLVQAMESGKIKGACLDVLEFESSNFDTSLDNSSDDLKYLKNSTRVVLSPHIAGWTLESNYKMSKFLAEKIIQTFGNSVV